MADNFTTPVPTGTVFASKDIGGVHHPWNLLADAAGADAMGEVQATPTSAYTILGRLKAIADGVTTVAGHVDGLEGLATTLNGLVDGLETLIGTSNTSLAALAGYVDGLEALATSLNGYVDGLETLQGTTNTTLAAISGYVDGLETLATALNGYVDGLEALAGAATPAGTNVIGKVGIDQTTDGTTNKVNIDDSLQSGTATRTTVASSITSGTILASNAARKGATICNQDTNALLLDLSAGTASSTRYQQRLTQYQSYEVAAGFTGAITGIWEADGSGQADVVEFT